MTSEELAAAARPFFAGGFGGVLRIETTDGGEGGEGGGASVWVEGRGETAVVQLAAPPGVEGAFCLWRAKTETFERLFTRERRRLESAYISGRLTIAGDMAVMARLVPAEG